MAEDGYITAEQARQARAQPLGVNPRVLTPNSIAAGFFAEEVRRELSERYGEQKLYEGGLSVRATLDPKIQLMARKALVDGLVRYDEAHGWHGALKSIDLGQDWGVPLADIPAYGDIKPWRPGGGARRREQRNSHRLAARAGQVRRSRSGAPDGRGHARRLSLDGHGRPRAWRSRATCSTSNRSPDTRANTGCGKFRKSAARASPWTPTPAASWPWLAGSRSTNPSSIARRRPSASRGRRSSRSSMRRRSTTAIRPPRSFSTSRLRSIRATARCGARRTSKATSSGPHTLRFGVEHSINQMTVRLARDIGMPLVVEYAKRFGIYDNLPPFLSMSIGAGETTVLRMVTGYSMFANGGKTDQGHPDRPHSGPLGQHHLQA